MTVRTLVEGVEGPLNVMVDPGRSPSPDRPRQGWRVSARVGHRAAAHAVVRRAARELRGTGTYDSPAEGHDWAQLNALMGSR
ncbi:hypothetical protein [Streptomyces sp. NPDC093544]|uniref:hypothetical protein n=1 Tax=Streptomyces sp. NPDC093544 TaxID=3155200 RepID=UPI00343FF1F4